MSTNGLIYITGIIVSWILTLIIRSYYKNHTKYESGELTKFTGYAAFSLLSWTAVIVLVFEFKNQIKEMLLFKRNDNTTI